MNEMFDAIAWTVGASAICAVGAVLALCGIGIVVERVRVVAERREYNRWLRSQGRR